MTICKPLGEAEPLPLPAASCMGAGLHTGPLAIWQNRWAVMHDDHPLEQPDLRRAFTEVCSVLLLRITIDNTTRSIAS